MKIFIDSTFIISLLNNNDPYHESAINIVNDEELLKTNNLFTSNLVLDEIVSVIGAKLGLEAAINAYDLLNDNCTILNEYEIKNFNEKVMDVYRSTEAKLSFTDCSIIVVLKEFDIDSLVSFDKEFKEYIQ